MAFTVMDTTTLQARNYTTPGDVTAWKVLGLSRYGSFRELDNNGYQSGSYLPSRDIAIAGPFIVDGRVLDRAEFVLAAED